MKNFINKVLLIVNIISFVIASLLCGVLGIYEQITGPAHVERLLEKLHISLSFDQVVTIGFVSIVLMFSTFFLRVKLSEKS